MADSPAVCNDRRPDAPMLTVSSFKSEDSKDSKDLSYPIITNINCTSVASRSYGFHYLAALCRFTAYFGSSEAAGQTATSGVVGWHVHHENCEQRSNRLLNTREVFPCHSQIFQKDKMDKLVWKQITSNIFRCRIGNLQKPFTSAREVLRTSRSGRFGPGWIWPGTTSHDMDGPSMNEMYRKS